MDKLFMFFFSLNIFNNNKKENTVPFLFEEKVRKNVVRN